MCLLCVMEPGSIPTRQQLKNAADSNPHGYGYAFLTEDRIITGRGMDADEVIDRFLRIREGFPNTWAMFHARYTTHGATDKANCHPFRVGGSPDIVIGHNGILPVDVPKHEDRSDTRIFAEDILPDLVEWLDDPHGWQMLEDFAGSSKIAVFSLDPRLQSNIYIINEGYGHWTDGIWWSNDTYKSSSWGRTYSKFTSLWDTDYDNPTDSLNAYSVDDEWWKRQSNQECIYCNNALTDSEWEWGYCDYCKSCLNCAQDIVDCECYSNVRDRVGTRVTHWWEEEAFQRDSKKVVTLNTKNGLQQIEM